jgi:hypothetical protein
MSQLYRERAEFCRTMANRAMTDEIKGDWLRLAETWLVLATEDLREMRDYSDAARANRANHE